MLEGKKKKAEEYYKGSLPIASKETSEKAAQTIYSIQAEC